jgi:thiamine biosynthesis lipoprotein
MSLLPRLWGVVLMSCCALASGCANEASGKRPAGTAPARALERFEYEQVHMGTRVRLEVYAADEQTAVEGCSAAYRRVAELEETFTDYRKSSELMRLCAQAGGPAVRVSDELFFVLQRAVEKSRKTGGAFDVTVGPVVQLWRAARRSGKMPQREELEKARALVGWEKIELDPVAQTVKLAVAGMRLDCGAIAKGYAGDCALAVLRTYGINSALFEAGGNIVVSDAPPGSEGWVIEVANDRPGAKSKMIVVKNCGVSTSGDTEQYVEIEGKRYSHIVDPRTGIGVTNRNYVTVVGPDGITSDGLSAAGCVLGEEGMRAMLREYPGVRAYFAPAMQ